MQNAKREMQDRERKTGIRLTKDLYLRKETNLCPSSTGKAPPF